MSSVIIDFNGNGKGMYFVPMYQCTNVPSGHGMSFLGYYLFSVSFPSEINYIGS